MSSSLADLASQVRNDLWGRQVSEREHLLVEVLLRISFDLGKRVARVPRLEDLSAITGITKGNVHALLQRLVEARVVAVNGTDYRVLPCSGLHTWLLRPRVDMTRSRAALSALVVFQSCEQQPLLPPEPSLADAVADVCVEEANPVPNFGTAFLNTEPRSENGNTSRSTDPNRSRESFDRLTRFDAVPREVPDRGWLLAKLSRIPRLHAEVMRPQNGHQRRMSRMFWLLAESDATWLAGALGDLADAHEIRNKAAYFNQAATSRCQFLEGGQVSTRPEQTNPPEANCAPRQHVVEGGSSVWVPLTGTDRVNAQSPRLP